MGFAIYSTVQFFKPLIKEGFELFKQHLLSMNESMQTMARVLEQIDKRVGQLEESFEYMIGRKPHRDDDHKPHG
jgi:hypothetical protein